MKEKLKREMAGKAFYESADKVITVKRQETLEEAAENYGWRIKRNTFSDPVKANDLANSAKEDFIEGAKWQAERMYSEEEVIQLLIKFNQEIQEVEDVKDWFKQFKKI